MYRSERSLANIIVFNGHASSEEKSDDSKDTFYVELGQVFFLSFS
jgi:hypothetical protein